MSKNGQRYVIQAVVRAVQVLKVFSIQQPEMTLMEISRSLDLNPSTAFRLLVTLQTTGLVEQNPENRKYRLGPTCLQLGSIFLRHSDIRAEAMPFLIELRNGCKETIHLAQLVGIEVVYLEKLEGLLSVGVMGSRVGGRSPAHCTGLGKALLAYRSEDEIREAYASGMERFTPNTITDLEGLLEGLAQVRKRGYAIDDGEHERDVKCIAVPIWDHRQEVVASISVSGPAARMSRRIDGDGFVSRVVEVGQVISSRLAGRSSE